MREHSAARRHRLPYVDVGLSCPMLCLGQAYIGLYLRCSFRCSQPAGLGLDYRKGYKDIWG